jgi:TetR/AcrR family transcriptional regulator, regulator of autoinduction and epiphytic fitness
VTTAPADGRTARKTATRDAIADALLDLLSDGQLRPTAREIAQRAGLSVRSVYVHFDDLDDLYCVSAGRAYARVAPLLEPAPDTGPLRDRVAGLVERRVQLYARIGGIARATQLQAPFSPTLARIVRDTQQRARREIERVFAHELDQLSAPRRSQVVAVASLLTAGSSLQQLLEMHELSEADATASIVDAIVAVIEAAT